MFDIHFDDHALKEIKSLKNNPSQKKQYKAVLKVIKIMQTNLRHPSLNTHKFKGAINEYGKDIFESYAQNKTPGAYRVFWCYGPCKRDITIIKICKHP